MAAPLDLSDVGTVMDIVVPAAHETDYELDGWTVTQKGGTRTLKLTLTKDLEVAQPSGNGEGQTKPSDAQVQRIHHSAEQGALPDSSGEE